jgi:hypothetical protein
VTVRVTTVTDGSTSRASAASTSVAATSMPRSAPTGRTRAGVSPPVGSRSTTWYTKPLGASRSRAVADRTEMPWIAPTDDPVRSTESAYTAWWARKKTPGPMCTTVGDNAVRS